MRNVLTVDVEDYYHVSAFESVVRYETWEQYESRVEKNTYHILDVLERYQTKATFFVLGWVAERHPQLIREIAQCGHEVASHGYSHKRIYTQTPEQFRAETQRSKKLLEDTIGQAVQGYRAASYSITAKSLWALDILIEEGFLYDSSIFPIWHDLYGIPNAQRFFHVLECESGSINEYPLSTARIVGMKVPMGGGGYLRLFPYAFSKWAIKRLNYVEHEPAIIYVHPWEFDPGQPRLTGKWRSRFRHYVNLHKTEDILKSLLEDFSFGTMAELNMAHVACVAGQGE
jgi:polysaccharide deacetylase family protein (PEP-CTERM system associated)